ncbi:nuclear cap-binding protein subunit 1 [Sporothrix schenckii 1099-18]|uniref:Nuclear cap-binding protein subunit 1 n=1 Tax=Sporothrix schenckii 1099-18 TaxID=1397361 RepID=A0A0F2M4P4_SPOSC|nr:nuclear cap-binding protein subunit 1 [Sporothrix schenckii 1099-18]KJR83780.1 nuclear cap-binding protein subunit 1 [Sporothrix schenckii 1099-18]
MADYDRRGGHNNYQNNRKRRYRDDDDNEFRNQRRRSEPPAPVRIRRRLLALAESPLSRWDDEVVDIARLVTSTDDNGPTRESFVRLACQMVREQPLKTPFVAALLLIVNALKPDIVLDVLRAVAAATESAIAEGRWREVKLQLRLIACLQPCLEGDGVFPLLDTLFARAVDLQTASSDDVIGTELVKIILLTIPYVMTAVSASSASSDPENTDSDSIEQWRQRAAGLMEKTDIIASEPHALQGLMDPYHHGIDTGRKAKKAKGAGDAMEEEEEDDNNNDDNDDDETEADGDNGPPPAESVIALLQKQLQAEAASGWPLTCLPRMHKLPLEEAGLQEKAQEPATRHPLPAIAVPETVIAGPRALFPEVYFSVYGAWVDEDEGSATSALSPQAAAFLPHSVPPLTDAASSLIRDILLDTINGLDFNRNATARFLIDIDCYFADGTFVKRATPYDRLREIEPGKSTWKPEDVAVDTVFAQLFQLPQPEHKLVYYHAVLAEACKIAPAAIAPSLGRAIRFLYRNSPRMDLELVGRFVDWFAHHLSNFGFTWKWAEWVDDVDLPDLHPHKAFILAAIDKEIRLSFAQRIKNTLPEPYQALIDPNTEQDVPPFKYAEPKEGAAATAADDVPFAAEGRELAVLLKRKAADEDVQAVIERIHSQALDAGLDPLVTSTDVFTTAVLWVGSKSLSHVLAAIERTKDRLLDAGAASEAARTQILVAVMAFWGAHSGVAVSITEKLLNYAILTPDTIVQWALSKNDQKGASASLAVNYVAELVFNTVDKVTRRVHQLVGASQTAATAVAAATQAVEAARERQRNPPPPPPPPSAAVAAPKDGDLDVAMDEDAGAASSTHAAASAMAEAVAAAAADADAAVEAAEAARVQATADLEAARAAEAAETKAMRDLFRLLGEALQPWLAGDDSGLAKAWAVRWQRVVQRRAAVEEAFLRGEAQRIAADEAAAAAAASKNGADGESA